jgi:hypothetical protein
MHRLFAPEFSNRQTDPDNEFASSVPGWMDYCATHKYGPMGYPISTLIGLLISIQINTLRDVY